MFLFLLIFRYVALISVFVAIFLFFILMFFEKASRFNNVTGSSIFPNLSIIFSVCTLFAVLH